jgi:AcrR family transcriptional regulator
MTRKAKRISETAASGETALILAAERLFAEQGIEAVALRHINQAANQRNMSAAHYHFGSRDGLVRAVLMYRWPELDRRRDAMLENRPGPRDLRFYLEAFILPLIEELTPRQEGNYYLRFMQQYARFRGDYTFARQFSPAGVAIYDHIDRLIGYVPTEVRRLRIANLINMIHAVLAIAEERLGKQELYAGEIDLIASNLVDMIGGALNAPLSVDTLELLSTASAGTAVGQ